jgi:uncharacterized protein YggU (UPF0235/DUF167 family)
VRIAIRVRPGASRTAVGGSHDGALVVAVGERAVEGKATAAALKAVAKAWQVPARDVLLVAGATSRTKTIEVPDEAAERLRQLLAER